MHRADRWLAVLRIAAGLWFVKAVYTKWVLLGGVLPVPLATQRWIETMPRIIEGYAEVNPWPWCQEILQDVVIANAEVFAHLTAIGEGLVGIGLTAGLLTRVSAAGGLFLIVVYQLAAMGLPYPVHGMRLLLIVAMFAFYFARAGNTWGADEWIARRRTTFSNRRFTEGPPDSGQ